MRTPIKYLFDILKHMSADLKILSGTALSVFILMWVLNPQRFISTGNFQSMAFQMPELGLLSIAMMITMLTGGINLSIIATANLSGIVTALIVTRFTGAPSETVFILALVSGLATSLAAGAFNGALIAYTGISPILATLGTMTLIKGICIVITKGYVISGLPQSVQWFGNATLISIPLPMLLFILSAAVLSLILNRTRLGFNIYMLGSNPLATRFSGVSNEKVIMWTYSLSGLLCGIASLIMIGRFNSAKAGYGESYLLVTILAAVLGGVNTNGGFGKISGLVLSLVILQFISSGLNLLGVSSFLTLAIWGVIILAVMIINDINRRRIKG